MSALAEIVPGLLIAQNAIDNGGAPTDCEQDEGGAVKNTAADDTKEAAWRNRGREENVSPVIANKGGSSAQEVGGAFGVGARVETGLNAYASPQEGDDENSVSNDTDSTHAKLADYEPDNAPDADYNAVKQIVEDGDNAVGGAKVQESMSTDSSKQTFSASSVSRSPGSVDEKVELPSAEQTRKRGRKKRDKETVDPPKTEKNKATSDTLRTEQLASSGRAVLASSKVGGASRLSNKSPRSGSTPPLDDEMPARPPSSTSPAGIPQTMPMYLPTFKPATGCTNASDFIVRCFVARLRSGITVVKHGRSRWCKSRLR